MISIPATALLAALKPRVVVVPFVQGKVAAGFPSPADDFLVKRHDLNELLIKHPQATFFWQVSGHSMREAGIDDGDILVVDRALKPRHGCIVVAQVDGDFTVKTLHKRADRVKLVPANPTFPEITFREGQQLIICGVVTAAIKRFSP
jgi:DNA polymerase V